MPGVRGTSGGRDGEEKKMAPWAPRLMLSLVAARQFEKARVVIECQWGDKANGLLASGPGQPAEQFARVEARARGTLINRKAGCANPRVHAARNSRWIRR